MDKYNVTIKDNYFSLTVMNSSISEQVKKSQAEWAREMFVLACELGRSKKCWILDYIFDIYSNEQKNSESPNIQHNLLLVTYIIYYYLFIVSSYILSHITEIQLEVKLLIIN